jgi:hypothetical protein
VLPVNVQEAADRSEVLLHDQQGQPIALVIRNLDGANKSPIIYSRHTSDRLCLPRKSPLTLAPST